MTDGVLSQLSTEAFFLQQLPRLLSEYLEFYDLTTRTCINALTSPQLICSQVVLVS